jgi:HK97 family phage portal protein
VSLFFKRDSQIQGPESLIPPRPGVGRGTASVSSSTAMRHSAVWACLRLRADLVSTMPIDVFRRIGAGQVEVPKPPVLVNPGGERVGIEEWMYSTSVDLDRSGNTVGLITEKDGGGRPRRIDLQPLDEVTIEVRKGELHGYRICGEFFTPDKIWHERQFTLSGIHVGLSPVAHAAWSISQYLSALDFTLDWFGNGAVPSAHLRNKEKTLTPPESAEVKTRFKASVQSGDVFVTGSDWEYNMLQAKASETQWLEAQQTSISDVARFFGAPSDLIDAAVSGQSVTYANIAERNLQFLVLNLGPAVVRRERALTKLVASPRYVKLNSDALLRMDPKSRAEMLKLQIDSRTLAPSEARELDNRLPFTPSQLDEFEKLFGAPRALSPTATTGATP